jgi:hypothetical protein
MPMLGEPADPRMDPEPVMGVLGWDDDARDGLGGVMGGTVLLWEGSALPGEVGAAAAAAAAGEPMRACGLDGDPGACILPWESEPEAKEVPTPPLSCLPGGVGMGGAEAEELSFLLEGGRGAKAGDSVSADLFVPLLPAPLPDPEELPVEEEGLEGLSFLGVPDMRSQMLMGPAQRGVGWTAGSECFPLQREGIEPIIFPLCTPTAKGRN